MAKVRAPQVANPPFNKVYWAVIVIFFTCLAVQVSIGIWGGDKPNAALQDAANGCGAIWKIAGGAIVGMLGGRAGAPNSIEVTRPDGGGRKPSAS
jgi:hypothetical protein